MVITCGSIAIFILVKAKSQQIDTLVDVGLRLKNVVSAGIPEDLF
jgi:hypothetical protein